MIRSAASGIPSRAAIDGNATQSTGEERRFDTPPLRVGGRYHYTLKATTRGKEVTRHIELRHGGENSIDLRPAFAAVAAERPGSRTNIIFVICDQETYHPAWSPSSSSVAARTRRVSL
jgi:uncharacterized protein (TIGR03000 family)